MSHRSAGGLQRRGFLGWAALAGTAGLMCRVLPGRAAEMRPRLQAGEGTVDITPPLGIEMGGHRKPGNERRIRGIRQPTAARALVLAFGDTQVALCSIDIVTIPEEMADRIRQEVATRTGIPAENVRLCATHTHSTPHFHFLRQCGAIPFDYMKVVEKRVVEAVVQAKADLVQAEVLLGKTRVVGGNHNRTVKGPCSTDVEFTKDSTDAQRWLDTMLHVVLFHRNAKRTLAWYHFSAHAVCCYPDDLAGPDWPGTVAECIRQKTNLVPSFLQGHGGDVNPGNGSDWLGEMNQTTEAITPALERAIAQAQPVQVDCLRTRTRPFEVPFDLERFESWRELYRKDPAKCTGSQWVDAGFAADWYRANAHRNWKQSHLPITLSAVQLGPIGLVFHPAELFSYYGLAIRRGSPLRDTLVVGYTDGIIGYLPDPTAFQKGEYAAVAVPKYYDRPPYTPGAAAGMSAAALELLRQTVA